MPIRITKIVNGYFQDTLLITGVIVTTIVKYGTDLLNNFPIEHLNHYLYFVYLGALTVLAIKKLFFSKKKNANDKTKE